MRRPILVSGPRRLRRRGLILIVARAAVRVSRASGALLLPCSAVSARADSPLRSPLASLPLAAAGSAAVLPRSPSADCIVPRPAQRGGGGASPPRRSVCPHVQGDAVPPPAAAGLRASHNQGRNFGVAFLAALWRTSDGWFPRWWVMAQTLTAETMGLELLHLLNDWRRSVRAVFVHWHTTPFGRPQRLDDEFVRRHISRGLCSTTQYFQHVPRCFWLRVV